MKHFLYLMAMMGVLIVSAKGHLQKEALDSNAKKTFAAVTKMLPENGAVDVNIDTQLTLVMITISSK